MKTMVPLRYAGGKTRLLPQIRSFLPQTCRNYFEPFVGGGAVFFDYGHRATEGAYLNDICSPLIMAYRELPKQFSVIEDSLCELMESSYEEIRSEFNEIRLSSNVEEYPGTPRAVALFLALNHLCFNGVWRENKKGEFNVPLGKDSKGNPRLLTTIDFNKLKRAAELLSKVKEFTADSFFPWPFSEVPSPGSVVFYDPPYYTEFSDYNKDGFGKDMHELLCEQSQSMAELGATVVLCASNSEASRSIYGEPTLVIELNRTVGHSKRGKAKEALYVSNGAK